MSNGLLAPYSDDAKYYCVFTVLGLPWLWYPFGTDVGPHDHTSAIDAPRLYGALER